MNSTSLIGNRTVTSGTLVRTIREEDRTAVARLLVEQFGPVDPRWLGSMPPAGEKGFAVEVAGQIAGVGWVSLVNGQGRLHSLSVRPGYRRLGVGTDLWQARVLWSRASGAGRVITEVSEQNLPSLAIAAQGGMRNAGRMFLYHPRYGPAGLT